MLLHISPAQAWKHTVKRVSTEETEGGLCIVEDDADMAVCGLV